MPVRAIDITPELAAIGRAIREARDAKGLKQSDLAGRLGVSQAAIAGWELGRRAPSLSQLPALAAALDLSAATLAKKIFAKIAECT